MWPIGLALSAEIGEKLEGGKTLSWALKFLWAPYVDGLSFRSFLTNLFAATQNIARDGLAVDLLKLLGCGFANGIQVAGIGRRILERSGSPLTPEQYSMLPPQGGKSSDKAA